MSSLSEMDPELRSKILRDYGEAYLNVDEILEKRSPNNFVSEKKYLKPRTSTVEILFHDEKGKLKYFTKIRDTLGDILLRKKVEYSSHFEGAPDYVKGFLLK